MRGDGAVGVPRSAAEVVAESLGASTWWPAETWQREAAAVIAALAASGFAVVQLPKPDEIDDDGQLWFSDWEIRVDLTGREPSVYHKGNEVSAAMLRQCAAEFLAAAAEVSGVVS